MNVHQFLQSTFRNSSRASKIIDYVIDLMAHEPAVAKNGNWEREFTSGDHGKFAQRLWELQLSALLRRSGYTPEYNGDEQGPDFAVEIDGQRAYVEAVAPDLGRGDDAIPADWMKRPRPGVTSPPFEAIALRWTQAIAAKNEKIEGYVRDGCVLPNSPYVVALNSALLGWDAFTGLSQLPFAVEVTYAIGAMELTFDHGGAHRRFGHAPSLTKRSGASVKKAAFMDSSHAGISALLACHCDVGVEADSIAQLPIVVHNACARNRIALSKFGNADEFLSDPDCSRLHRIHSSQPPRNSLVHRA